MLRVHLEGERIEARLRVVGTDDVLITADARPRGSCWYGVVGPGDPSRICSGAGPEILGPVRRLLSGY